MSQTNPSTVKSDLVFAPEDNQAQRRIHRTTPWKILIVDDEPGVHEVTQMSLKNFEFNDRPIEFLNAYTAQAAKELLHQHDDIAVALIDVVMESEHAGLHLIRYIREVLDNRLIRLVLRTGQPGQAPERKVIREYDINDYREKTELTSQKLYSTVYTSLRSYRDLIALENNRRGLKHIINASAHLFPLQDLNEFIQGVLEQLVALLYLEEDALYVSCDCLAFQHSAEEARVIAATGRYASYIDKNAAEAVEPHVYELLREAHEKKRSIIREKEFVGFIEPQPGCEEVLYVYSEKPLSQNDLGLIELFLHNVSIAYENIILRNEIDGTQRDMLYMLGESIETRSNETGQHVRRVAAYCRLIALGIGLSEREADLIEIASPLHDIGKIGVPDDILHKPGKLTDEEWEIMKSHTTIGYDLLNNSSRETLKSAAIIAGQHHEHWDGNGYPAGLQGDDIHIFARIVAIADVFDALGSDRIYKKAWPIDEIVKYLQSHRSSQFDPALIDWVMDNLDAMTHVRKLYPDAE